MVVRFLAYNIRPSPDLIAAIILRSTSVSNAMITILVQQYLKFEYGINVDIM